MSEEMKLLMALCDALGFAVEVNHDRQERKEEHDSAMRHNKGCFDRPTDRRLKTKSSGMGMMLDIDDDGMYTSFLNKPITSYKLTRLD